MKSVHFLTRLNFDNSSEERYQIPSDVVDACNIYLLHIQLSAQTDITDINVNQNSGPYRVGRVSATQAVNYKTILATTPELQAGEIVFNPKSVSGPNANMNGQHATSIIIKGSSLTGTVDIWGYY